MKVRGISVSLIIILVCATIFFGGCKDSDDHSSEKAITSYSLNGVDGTINETEKTIAVAMPSLTNVYSLVATFTSTGARVDVGATQQVSGTTPNDFSSPVTYTVTAEDGSTAIYNVTVTVNRAWHHPASLTDNISSDGQNTTIPQVATDDYGNAIIVWEQSGNIFKSEYRNGVWTNPANLNDYIDSGFNPQVAMDNNGNAIIVWEQAGKIFKSEYRNDVWQLPRQISPQIDTATLQLINMIFVGSACPRVAMDNNGNAIIVWQQFYDTGNNSIINPIFDAFRTTISPDFGNGIISQIFKSEYRNGVWTHPANFSENISIDGTGWTAFPQVAMDNNGNAIIVWLQFDGTNNQIFKSEYREGAWTNPSSLTDNISPDGQNATMPEMAMDNNGNAIIVWSQSDGTDNQIFKSEYRSGVWTHPASVADNISPDGAMALYPQVAMDNNGNAIIVWSQLTPGSWPTTSGNIIVYAHRGVHGTISERAQKAGVSIDFSNIVSSASISQIFKSEYRNGAWTNPVNISVNGQDTGLAHVAMDDGGSAIIVWSQFDGTNSQIFKSEYREGAWNIPASLADNISPDGQNAAYPHVAMDNTGNAIIVWEQSDGTNYQIFKSEYR